MKGLALNWVVDTSKNVPTFTSDDLMLVQQAGAQAVRIDLRLGGNTSWTTALIGAYQQVITLLQDHGITVLGLLGTGVVTGSQSQWNADNAENGGNGTNPWVDSYVAAVKTVINAFPSIHLWEVLNEPNSWTTAAGTTYSGGSFVYPSVFANVLNGAHAAIKTHNSSDTVISGGLLAHDNSNTSTASAGSAYLDNLYLWGGWDTYTTPFDAVGLHFYIDQLGALNPVTLQRYIDYYLSADVVNEGEGRWKSVYITELGWTTAQVSEAQQASNLTRAFSVLKDQPYIKGIFNFQLQDNPGGSQYYGLYHSDGTPKAALTSFQKA